MNEYIEFHSETTSWTIHVTGHGVLPKYEIKPITSVWRYECKNNKNIDIFLEVSVRKKLNILSTGIYEL